MVESAFDHAEAVGFYSAGAWGFCAMAVYTEAAIYDGEGVYQAGKTAEFQYFTRPVLSVVINEGKIWATCADRRIISAKNAGNSY